MDVIMNNNIMNMAVDAVVTSRFDIMLFLIGLMGYAILVSSRAAKNAPKKFDITFEPPQVVDADPGEDSASASSRLSRVLVVMETCDPDSHFLATAQMDGFIEDYPQHPFTLREVQIVLGFCRHSVADRGLVDRLIDGMEATEDWAVLSTFLRFYIDTKQHEKACDVFELNYSTFYEMELDEEMEWPLLIAASACGRQSLADHLLHSSQTNYAKPVVSIQQWWRRSATKLGESRVESMGEVLTRLSGMFNQRFPFEEQEHSDDESTCFLGDDSDREDSDSDSAWEEDYNRS